MEDQETLSEVQVLVGDRVVAQDGSFGHVDGVVSSGSNVPAYLVVAVGRRLRRRYPVLPWSLVTSIDASRRQVRINGRRRQLGRLPETLPIVL